MSMVSEGYLAAGYHYVAIDDCWLDRKRDKNGNLRPNPQRFPNGIKHLADFVHKHGMKLGIYGAVGPTTCMRFPGNAGHIEQDALQYAEWGVDMFKFDGCFVPLDRLKPAYVSMSKQLNQTTRHIAYLCSWPYYLLLNGHLPPWDEIRRQCNMWRVADDVSESLGSILNIIATYERLQRVIAPLAGPGAWNDADQLLIGNDGLSEDDCRIQMAMWSILASPLFMSVDLEEIEPWAKNILLNERAIAINQDPLGKQGVKLAQSPPGLGVWVKEIAGSGLAIAFLRVQQKHRREDDTVSDPIHMSIFKPFFPQEASQRKFRMDEVFEGEHVGVFTFRNKMIVERGNNDIASVMFVTLKLIDNEEAQELRQIESQKWPEKLAENDKFFRRTVYNPQQSAAYRFRLVACSFSLVVIIIVIVIVKLRFCIYRELINCGLYSRLFSRVPY